MIGKNLNKVLVLGSSGKCVVEETVLLGELLLKEVCCWRRCNGREKMAAPGPEGNRL